MLSFTCLYIRAPFIIDCVIRCVEIFLIVPIFSEKFPYQSSGSFSLCFLLLTIFAYTTYGVPYSSLFLHFQHSLPHMKFYGIIFIQVYHIDWFQCCY